ncbi:MAG: deoxyribose-phosphate aldolase [Spirochaetota bacterium]
MDKTRRMNHIFKMDGRSLIVAMDHGANAGVVKGLEQPAKVIEQIVAGGADAVIANMGFARRFAGELSGLGLIARLDIAATKLGTGHDSRLVYKAEYALKLGADAVIVNGGPGKGVEEITLPNIARIVAECESLGMPVAGEMVPGGFDSDQSYKTLENLVLSARIASELGVDFIKIGYKPGFKKVVEGCFCPVVVLGGAKTDDQAEFLASIKDAIQSGAAGVAIGRNIWGAPNPLSMTRALAALIHAEVSVERAVEILNS